MSVNLSNWYTLDSEIVSINYLLGQRIFGLPLGGSNGKESACNVGDWGSIPGLGRSPGAKGKANHSMILAWRVP